MLELQDSDAVPTALARGLLDHVWRVGTVLYSTQFYSTLLRSSVPLASLCTGIHTGGILLR